MKENPFFSIVTVCLNAEKLIKMTIDSILVQQCEDYELIVKDGGSTDNTLNLIQSSPKVKLILVKDIGIYDAMNQAIAYTRGKYILFLNCGDVLYSDETLSRTKAFINNGQFGFIYGDYSRDAILHKQPHRLSRFSMYRTPLCHQSIFFNGDLLRKNFKYNTSYSILADYDLELRIIPYQPVAYHDLVICSYLGGGVSESTLGIMKKSEERKVIISSYFSKTEQLFFLLIWRLSFPSLRARIIGKSNRLSSIYQSIVNRINSRGKL